MVVGDEYTSLPQAYIHITNKDNKEYYLIIFPDGTYGTDIIDENKTFKEMFEEDGTPNAKVIQCGFRFDKILYE